MGNGNRGQMKTKDNSRKWMWGFLGLVVALQMYFVWELLAVFALFAVGFAAIAAVVGSLYMLVRTWAVAVAPGRKQASGAGSGETGTRYRGRYGAPSVSASRLRDSPLINLRTF